MANDWIMFVKKYAKDNNMKYNEALKVAGKHYKKKDKKVAPKKEKKMKKMKGGGHCPKNKGEKCNCN